MKKNAPFMWPGNKLGSGHFHLVFQREPSLLEARLKGFVWEFIVRSIKQLKCT